MNRSPDERKFIAPASSTTDKRGMPRALVTGANRGIGRSIAEGLVAAGYEVIAASRREPPTPVGTWRKLDVTSADDIAATADAVEALDVLVNNAGVALDGFDEQVARRTLDVNVLGALNLTDALLPRMAEGGRVIMVSSGMGELAALGPAVRPRFTDPALDREGIRALADTFVADVANKRWREEGWPGSAYRVSKALLNALTRVYARALADDPRGVRVHAMCPGWVATDMGGESAPRTPREGADTAVWLALEGAALEGGRFYRDRRRIPF